MILQRMIINLVVSFSSKTRRIILKHFFSSENPIQNSTMLPTSEQYYDDSTYENYRQHYANTPMDNYQQQQQNEQQLLQLSLGNK